MLQENQFRSNGRPGEFNCIWMTSNVVDYQVCEKNFDCETCSLDVILKNLESAKASDGGNNLVLNCTDFLDRIIAKLEGLETDAKLIYLNNNLVLKHLFANIYYLGINPLTVALLDNVKSVKEYMKKVYFTAGQNIIELHGEWGALTIKAPMSFMLLDKLNWTPEDVISRNWLALIIVNQNEIIDSQISGDDWKIEKSRIIKYLNELRDSFLKINPALLTTSEKMSYIYQLTGNAEYLRLLNISTGD